MAHIRSVSEEVAKKSKPKILADRERERVPSSQLPAKTPPRRMARKAAVWANVAGASLVSSARRAQSFFVSRSRRKVTKKAAVFFLLHMSLYIKSFPSSILSSYKRNHYYVMSMCAPCTYTSIYKWVRYTWNFFVYIFATKTNSPFSFLEKNKRSCCLCVDPATGLKASHSRLL